MLASRSCIRPSIVAVAAIVVGAAALVVDANEPVGAAPSCSDVMWIGAAGSGERDGAARNQNNGMGRYVNESYLNLTFDLVNRGWTIDFRAVDYPATAVPGILEPGKWGPFLDGLRRGVDATRSIISEVTASCPRTKIVLAGYSQGAMVMHRLLQSLGDLNGKLAGALLIADGDRLFYDTAKTTGSASIPFLGNVGGEGVAQANTVLSGASGARFPQSLGDKILTACNLGDPVCSYNPASTFFPFILSAIHTAYLSFTWRNQFDDMLIAALGRRPTPTTTPRPTTTTQPTTTTSTPPQRSPDGNCGDPWIGKNYWVRCVVVWRNEPIGIGANGNYTIADTNMPSDLQSYRYTTTGRDQLQALGLTTNTPTEWCNAPNSQCEIPWGTPTAAAGVYATQAEYSTGGVTRTVDWYLQIVER